MKGIAMRALHSLPVRDWKPFWGYVSWGLIGFAAGCAACAMVQVILHWGKDCFDWRNIFLWLSGSRRHLTIDGSPWPLSLIPALVALGLLKGWLWPNAVLGNRRISALLLLVAVAVALVCAVVFTSYPHLWIECPSSNIDPNTPY
jgi:hypothetical protein